jgi:hypothetical protein
MTVPVMQALTLNGSMVTVVIASRCGCQVGISSAECISRFIPLSKQITAVILVDTSSFTHFTGSGYHIHHHSQAVVTWNSIQKLHL